MKVANTELFVDLGIDQRITRLPMQRFDRRDAGCSRRTGIVTIALLLLIAGCSPHPRKAETKPPAYVHRARVIAVQKTARHELTDAEKDKIFEGFERWLAEQSRDGQTGRPLRNADASAIE
jgi:hypothetical protein